MKKIRKEWIGKLGNSVYKIDYDETAIYPQGIDMSMKFMESSIWLDGFNKQHLERHKKELEVFLTRLHEVYDYLAEFKWSEEKEREYLKALKKGNTPKEKKEKKESGA